MKFDLVRPCPKCPFRRDIKPYLTLGRVRELARELVQGQKSFSCHQTVDYGEGDDGEEEQEQQHIPSTDEQHCAGAAILLERIGQPNQMMRWMERIRGKDGRPYYDARTLDMSAPVYDNFNQMLAAHRKRKTNGC